MRKGPVEKPGPGSDLKRLAQEGAGPGMPLLTKARNLRC